MSQLVTPRRGLIVPKLGLVTPRRQRGFLLNPYRYAVAGFAVDAAEFDGTNDYLQRTTNLTGAADSKNGIMSFWFNAANNNERRILAYNGTLGTAAQFIIGNASTDIGGDPAKISTKVSLGNGTGSTNLSSITSAQLVVNTWHHVLWSWDVATSTVNVYVNGTNVFSAPNTGAITNANMGYSGTRTLTVAADDNGGANKLTGAIAELYFAPGQFLDFTVQANREKFRSAAGKPVDLGATGSTPTGAAPQIFLHLADGEAPANFGTNRTGTGNFTVTGALTTFTTSPSD